MTYQKQHIAETLLSLPDFKKLSFDKEAHRYFLDENGNTTELFGITSLISEFKNPFDREGISSWVASRDGISQEEVLAQWDKTREDATDYGNGVHDAYEQLITNGVVDSPYELECSLLTHANRLLGVTPALAEYLVLEKRIMRSSAIDILAVNEKDELVILDIKTPAKGIEYEAYKNKTMLFPLQDLPDCSYYHYSLQISIYDAMLRQAVEGTGLTVADQHYLLYVRHDVCFPIPTLDLTKYYEKIITFKSR